MPERYFLIGGDVSSSPSPAMMNAAFAAAAIDASYSAVSVEPGRLEREFLRLKKEGASGLNVTIPFKTALIPFLDGVDPVAKRLRAVNTVKRTERGYTGFNTDVDGIVVPLAAKGVSRGIGSVLLIGAGGAARAFCEAMDRLGCRKITVATRAPSRAAAFAADMRAAFPRLALSLVPTEEVADGRYDLVFNASPAGSPGSPLPEPLGSALGDVVFDAVYRPVETELLRLARKRGSTVVYGYEMLLHQAASAFKIWTGTEAPVRVMEESLRSSLGRSAS